MAESAKEGEPKYEHLTDQIIGDALRADKGPDAQLVSWRAKDFTKMGDNYVCIVTSVIVQYKLDDALQEKTYVAKLSRDIKDEEMKDMMNPVFLKEGTCFREILPAMNKVLRQIGSPEIGVPKAYCCSYEKGREVLIVEDLRPRNYKMFDRRRGMDVPHARLVLQELGKLHAASLLLEKTLPNHSITKTWDVFTDPWVEDSESGRMFQGMIAGQLEGTAQIMDKVPNYDHVAKWIRKTKDTVLDFYRQCWTIDCGSSVLIHGDCWNNNVLFRYNEAGEPVEVMLVDLQVMRKTTPAAELNYFFYSSFNGPERKLNLEEFMKTYYDSFKSVLEAGGAPVPFTLEGIRQEFRDHMLFGCISGMLLIPSVLSEATDVLHIEDFCEENLEEIIQERKETVLAMSQREGGLLKPRLLDMFDEMIEEGVLP